MTTTLSAHSAEAALTYLRPGVLHLTSLPPLALYIHFPWCVKKCPYCDFNSHRTATGGEGFPEQAYLDALTLDLEGALPLIWGRKIMSVFIGGGTPSLMSAGGVDQLLAMLRARLPMDDTVEITLEANPGTFEVNKFKAYRASGINRLSIGIQSFHTPHLNALGRIHDGLEARRAVEIALQTFDNVNLDLMFALPHQTHEELRCDIETAMGYAPPHLSLYHLSLEPNTLFAKYPPPLPDDDTSADMQDMIRTLTSAAGYDHYEVSAYAKKGKRARHNLNYWQFGDYLGIGAGAHSKISFPHRIVRQVRYKQPKKYLEQAQQAQGPGESGHGGHMIQESIEVKRADLPFEFMLGALRLNEGINAGLFAERTGLALNIIEKTLNDAEVRGLLYRDHKIIRATDLGRRFLNDLQGMFLV